MCQSRDTQLGTDHSRLRALLCRKPHIVTSRALPPFGSFSAAKPERNKKHKPPEKPRVLLVPYLGLSGTY